MKNIFFINCFLFIAFVNSNAQSNNAIAILNSKIILSKSTVSYNDNMPNVLTGKDYTFKYSGNNGGGFNLYQSSVDNMIVAEPDSSSHFNMPIKKVNNINLNKLKELIEQQKAKQNNSSTILSSPYQNNLFKKDSLLFHNPLPLFPKNKSIK